MEGQTALLTLFPDVATTPPSLSQELTEYVEENNEAFTKELIEHDRNIQTAAHVSVNWRNVGVK